LFFTICEMGGVRSGMRHRISILLTRSKRVVVLDSFDSFVKFGGKETASMGQGRAGIDIGLMLQTSQSKYLVQVLILVHT
ncbi:hypothetical protein BpHYR1_053534, partial [Brachionus plicatilis]